jgi:GTP-binding protein HflX
VISRGLFTTLDPLSRAITLSNHQKVVISDTVGFIRQLPHHLIEAFKATLEEVVEADLLVHVLDISSPKPKELYHSVRQVLDELGAGQKDTILALNKIDMIESRPQLEKLKRDYPDSVFISALKGENLKALLARIEEKLSFCVSEASLALPLGRMDLVDYIYREGKVRDIDYSGDEVRIKALLPNIVAKKLKSYFR